MGLHGQTHKPPEPTSSNRELLADVLAISNRVGPVGRNEEVG